MERGWTDRRQVRLTRDLDLDLDRSWLDGRLHLAVDEEERGRSSERAGHGAWCRWRKPQTRWHRLRGYDAYKISFMYFMLYEGGSAVMGLSRSHPTRRALDSATQEFPVRYTRAKRKTAGYRGRVSLARLCLLSDSVRTELARSARSTPVPGGPPRAHLSVSPIAILFL